MEHGFLSQNKLYFILKTKRAREINFTYIKSNLASHFSFQLTQNDFHNNDKSLLLLEKKPQKSQKNTANCPHVHLSCQLL